MPRDAAVRRVVKEKIVDRSTEQQMLLTALLRAASQRAEKMLGMPDGADRIRPLLLSPYAEDQFVAVALRLHRCAVPDAALAAMLHDHFRVPPSAIAMAAQRRAIWSEDDGRGLPIDLAAMAASALERRLTSTGDDPCAVLAGHAELYTDLWCDPRIDAAPSARRIMLAMVGELKRRSDAFREPSGKAKRSGFS